MPYWHFSRWATVMPCANCWPGATRVARPPGVRELPKVSLMSRRLNSPMTPGLPASARQTEEQTPSNHKPLPTAYLCRRDVSVPQTLLLHEPQRF
jgi:hypothetical protein